MCRGYLPCELPENQLNKRVGRAATDAQVFGTDGVKTGKIDDAFSGGEFIGVAEAIGGRLAIRGYFLKGGVGEGGNFAMP